MLFVPCPSDHHAPITLPPPLSATTFVLLFYSVPSLLKLEAGFREGNDLSLCVSACVSNYLFVHMFTSISASSYVYVFLSQSVY